VDAAVLAAARAILLERGLAGLTLTAVAAQAGYDRRTVQLRWPGRIDLAAAAVADAVPAPIPPPATTTLAEDLRWLVDAGAALLEDPAMGRLIRRMVGEFDTDPRLREAYRTAVLAPWREAVAQATARARGRAELREDVDLALLTEMLFGPLITRTLMFGLPPDPDVSAATVDLVLRGVRTTPAA